MKCNAVVARIVQRSDILIMEKSYEIKNSNFVEFFLIKLKNSKQ